MSEGNICHEGCTHFPPIVPISVGDDVSEFFPEDPISGMIKLGETSTPKYYMPTPTRSSFVPATTQSHFHPDTSVGTGIDSTSVTSPRNRIGLYNQYEYGGNEDLITLSIPSHLFESTNQLFQTPGDALVHAPSPLAVISPLVVVRKWKKNKVISRPKVGYSPSVQPNPRSQSKKCPCIAMVAYPKPFLRNALPPPPPTVNIDSSGMSLYLYTICNFYYSLLNDIYLYMLCVYMYILSTSLFKYIMSMYTHFLNFQVAAFGLPLIK